MRPGKKDSGNSSTLVPHGQKHAATGEERLDAETLDLIEDGLVSPEGIVPAGATEGRDARLMCAGRNQAERSEDW
jgi:hypothetical protein